MHVTLIVPAPFETVSGGYIYDRRIVALLRDSGHTVEVAELNGVFPVADTVASDAARAAWDRLPRDTRPVIDGLALPAFRGLEDAIAARGTVGLIHHPVSLETGLSEADQALLTELEHRLFQRLPRVIVTSDTTAATLITRFHIPSERIRIIVPGTDPMPRSPGSAGGTSRILSVGTLIPRKGHEVLLHALARLRDLDWNLTLVGSPDHDPVHARALVALAEALAIAHRVRFAGELVDDALEAAWRAADVFALATYYEGYGMAIAEALRRGLPVVVTDGGAAGALVTPDAGFVDPVGDRDRTADSLRRLIADHALRRHMAGQAWQVGKTLPSWQAQAALFVSALA
jgi:glycosyltransferase involved in cell wall biosynthesis